MFYQNKDDTGLSLFIPKLSLFQQAIKVF